ncbi:protein cortex-like [Choristoneura fumiferana]|uniref:protein cortex-like n=1 Tax=Choristoneura fumiferana TaxID=7141 RepID=UPI003D155423
MDFSAFGKKTPSSQRARTDRFVAPRAAFDELRRRHRAPAPRPCSEVIWYSKYMNQKKYANHIDKAWGLEGPSKSSTEQGWPCVPRRRPHLCSADNVLDLPTYSSAPFPELLDWSNDNILVAALGTKYYKWSWRSQSPISKGFTLFNTACCRFDPTGEKLALGTDMQRVEIHNSWSKRVAGSWCRCSGLSRQYCHVTALDWSPTGNSFVIGCSRGTVTSFDRDAELISSCPATVNAIFLIRVSPDARYVAVAAVNSSQVLVMLWPELYDSRSIGSDWIVKTIAWHPWRSALLGIGGMADLKSWVALWDAPRAALRMTSRVSNSDFTLDTMLFSHRTGELVMSLWNTENQPYPKGSSQLVVMSGPQTVVDQWGEGRQRMDRVRTMVFSPDGTKLATATADEDLVIWNFLPQDNGPSDKTKRRRFSAIPSFIDQSIHGFSVR